MKLKVNPIMIAKHDVTQFLLEDLWYFFQGPPYKGQKF